MTRRPRPVEDRIADAGGKILAHFNRFAEYRRNHEVLFAILEDIGWMIGKPSDDTAGLRAKCEAALPMWNADQEFVRAIYAEVGETPPRVSPREAMINLILESGVAGLSTLEIRRLQEPLWPAIEAESAAERGAEVGQEPRRNVQ